MFAIRLYISALTLTFLVAALLTKGIGMLEATVVVCPLLYLVLDMRDELQALRLLEAQVSSLAS
jgi:superfamily II DNA helicase RecQ